MSYRYAELVAQKVAEAPPLTDEQISRLAILLNGPGAVPSPEIAAVSNAA